VPANTEASVFIPTFSRGNFTITESGRRLWPAAEVNDPGVLGVSDEQSAIKCVVSGGEYQFREAVSGSADINTLKQSVMALADCRDK